MSTHGKTENSTWNCMDHTKQQLGAMDGQPQPRQGAYSLAILKIISVEDWDF